jgi:alpha-1,2-mannosyltransferase
MQYDAPSARLFKWERIGIGAFLAVVVAFGVLVEMRTAFLSRKMGDLDAYLRPAWAIRVGQDIYQLKDDVGWHYNYPPLFAILMMPLADPPAGADRSGMLPFAASAAIWYILNLIFLACAVHWLAKALEEASTDPEVRTQPRGCRRWWYLRLWPILACLPPIGQSLMRGQVNMLVLALFCGMLAALVRRQSFRAGMWLAIPICIKVYPAFLLLYPLWRRDARCLAGCAVGLFLGLVLIPSAVFGLPRTWAYYQEFANVTLAPGLGLGSDHTRAEELTQVTATDSQSLLAMLHNTIYVDRATRPRQASMAVRLAALAIGGCLTLLTLLAASRKIKETATTIVLFPAALIVLMLLLSPVCHLHYFAFLVPLVMALLDRAWAQHSFPWTGAILALTLAANLLANTLPNIPGFELVRDVGLATYGNLLVWTVGIAVFFGPSRGGIHESTQPQTSAGLAA